MFLVRLTPVQCQLTCHV